MEKKTEKKIIDFACIVLAVLGFIALMFLAFTAYNDAQVKDNKCLVKMATDFCEEKGLNYHSVTWDRGPKFKCIEERRTYGGLEKYYFTDGELGWCLK